VLDRLTQEKADWAHTNGQLGRRQSAQFVMNEGKKFFRGFQSTLPRTWDTPNSDDEPESFAS
jgi:hypothetical protein